MSTICSKLPLCAFFAAILSLGGGCGRPTLNVNDAVEIQGQQTMLIGHAGRSEPLGGWRPEKGVNVTFLADGKVIGSAVSDQRGLATLCTNLPSDACAVAAKAEVRGVRLQGQGAVFHWCKDRTIVVFDIDDTIANTKFARIFLLGTNVGTTPIEGAQETLVKLSSRYNIA